MALLKTEASARRDHPQATSRRPPAAFRWIVTCLLWLASWGLPPTLHAQVTNPKEYQIKAIFLFNFVQFVEWPEAAFANPGAPIRIGVLGDDPFAGALETAVQGERVRQREIVIVRSTRIQNLQDCHVVFVCRSEQAQVGGVLSALSGRPTLIVGDMPQFAQRGGVINFYLEGQKVRFEINRAAAHARGLKLSSQLLGLARIVGPPVATGDR